MIFGGLLFSHGIAKWSNFDTMSTMFPDPLGIGSSASLSLAIFGEVICSLGFIVGAFYRLALIPMIFTMCIAFFVIHGADPFAVKDSLSIPKNAVAFSCASRGSSGSHAGRRKAWKSGSETRP